MPALLLLCAKLRQRRRPLRRRRLFIHLASPGLDPLDTVIFAPLPTLLLVVSSGAGVDPERGKGEWLRDEHAYAGEHGRTPWPYRTLDQRCSLRSLGGRRVDRGSRSRCDGLSEQATEVSVALHPLQVSRGFRCETRRYVYRPIGCVAPYALRSKRRGDMKLFRCKYSISANFLT